MKLRHAEKKYTSPAARIRNSPRVDREEHHCSMRRRPFLSPKWLISRVPRSSEPIKAMLAR